VLNSLKSASSISHRVDSPIQRPSDPKEIQVPRLFTPPFKSQPDRLLVVFTNYFKEIKAAARQTKAKKRALEFVISSGNSPEFFELTEETLDLVALFVELDVIKDRLFSVGLGRDYRFDAIFGELIPDFVGIISFVYSRSFDNVVLIDSAIKLLKAAAIMDVSATQRHSDALVFVDASGVNLGGCSASRASNSLLGALFFGAPAAC